MEDVERAVFEDLGEPPERIGRPSEREAEEQGRHHRAGTIVLLEAAFQFFAWRDDAEAAEALGANEEQVCAWRTGREEMTFPDCLTLASRVGLWAAQALRESEAP